MYLELSIAKFEDIEGTLALHYKYQVDSIANEDRDDGFVTTPFTEQELTELVSQEKGLFIAKKGGVVVAYAMAASWNYWSKWPMFSHMLKELDKLYYLDLTLDTNNSYQYGPICLDKSVRGSGLLERLFDYSREEMSEKYPVMVTFINKNNPRSIRAHTKKLNMEVIHEFEFNDNQYYELVYDTSKRLLRTE